jgi:hypothetical protein
VQTSTFHNTKLYHDLVTGRDMSGIIHLVNQTPIASYCKKQKTVETGSYGSEFIVAHHACEQRIDLRYTLCMMGIPIDGPAWVFGDNASVITSSTIPLSTLNKQHNVLSYHRVCESIATKNLYLVHVDSKYNPSDILTKRYILLINLHTVAETNNQPVVTPRWKACYREGMPQLLLHKPI